MSIVFIILAIIGGVVALVLILGLVIRKEYKISREIVIDAPSQKVFDYIKLLKNQDNFNKWVMVEPTMNREFKGTDGSVGFTYGWNGKKAGQGEQEIKAIEQGRKIATEIRFVRPFEAIAYADMTTEPLSDSQTKVTWKNTSTMKYPMNVMIVTVEKMLAKDMDTSLSNLKSILDQH